MREGALILVVAISLALGCLPAVCAAESAPAPAHASAVPAPQPAADPAASAPAVQRAQDTDEDGAALPAAERDRRAYQLLSEALQLVHAGRPSEARPLLEDAAGLDPTANSAAVHLNLGSVYNATGQPEKAVEQYQQALKFQPALASAMLNMGNALQTIGRFQEAIAWYERYLKAQPGDANAGKIRAVIARLKRDSSAFSKGDPRARDYFSVVSAEGLVRWPKEKLPIKVFVAPGAGVPGFREEFRDFLRQALDTWVDASGERLAWTEVDEKLEADLVCAWTGNPADVAGHAGRTEAGKTVLSTLKKGTVSEIQHGKILICTVPFDETDREFDDEAMRRICLHEVGHALGLHGHSPNNKDVMFFMTYVVPLEPSARDQATLMRIYDTYPKRLSAR